MAKMLSWTENLKAMHFLLPSIMHLTLPQKSEVKLQRYLGLTSTSHCDSKATRVT